jgi:tetratricopeptide (TPR) repeat protein
LCTLSFLRGELAKARELANQLLEITRKEQNDVLELEAQFILGDTLYWQGLFRQALACFEHMVANYRSAMGMLNTYGWDSVALGLSYIGLCRWHMGHLGEDLPMIARGIQRASTLDHTFTMFLVRLNACSLHLLRRDSTAALSEAELRTGLADDLGLQGDLLTKAFSDCAMLQEKPALPTLAELSQIVRDLQFQNTKLISPFFLAALAEGYGRIGKIDTALEKIADALAIIEVSSERQMETELYRLKGELLKQRGVPDPAGAEACFRQAIEIAQRQEAEMFELRATTSLARLLASQGRHDEARVMLAEVYGWFTQGFDTADLKEAKALLDELSL